MFEKDSSKPELHSGGTWGIINLLSIYILFYVKIKNKVHSFQFLRL
jgi:hypothetical protein